MNPMQRRLTMELKSAFIFNRRKRRDFRQRAKEEFVEARLKAAKWGVSYSVWDGEELLESSIRSIRADVDHINVVYQFQSWRGQPANDGLLPLLEDLKACGLVDELIEFKPDLALDPKTNERKKRNVGLDYARKVGCHYFMTMDCDEFFVSEELKAAKRYIVRKGITHSYCRQILYGYHPTHCLKQLTQLGLVPFFSKLRSSSSLKSDRRQPCVIDTTRCLAGYGFEKQFVLHQVNMHHMILLRKDVARKFANSSGRSDFYKKPPPDILPNDYFVVENQFNIDTSGWRISTGAGD